MITLRGHHLTLLYNCIQSLSSEYSRKSWEDSVIRCAIEDGKTKKHGLNTIALLTRALNSGEKIKFTDKLDDICNDCKFKERKRCKQFIPYRVSAASEDRATLHFYELTQRQYTSEFIQKRLKSLGPIN